MYLIEFKEDGPTEYSHEPTAEKAKARMLDLLGQRGVAVVALYRAIPFRARVTVEIEDSPAPAAEPLPPPVAQGQAAGDVLEGSAALPASVGTCPTPSAPAGGAADVVSQEEAELRDQVASVEASTTSAGPQAASPSGTHAQRPAEDRPAEPDGQSVPEEGATASPDAANEKEELGEEEVVVRWGRPPKDGLAWHGWLTGTALCEDPEAAKPLELLAEGVRPRAAEACIDCAALVGWEAPNKLSMPDAQPAKEPARIRPRPEAKEPANFCEEMNLAANVPCGAKASAGKVGNRWLCKRHSKRTSSVQAQPAPGAVNG